MPSTSRSPVSCAPSGPEVVFRLFACCIAVRGARRSVICDLGRQLLRFIPNGLYEILTEHGDKNVAELKALYEGRYDREIDEYFNFLLREELGFWCDEPAAFPPLTLDWESPQRITNAILDVDRGSTHDYTAILAQLDDLGCEALQVRCYEPLDGAVVERMLAATVRGRLRSIELLLAHEPGLTAEALTDLCLRHPRIWRICVHSAPEDRACTATAGGAEIAYVQEGRRFSVMLRLRASELFLAQSGDLHRGPAPQHLSQPKGGSGRARRDQELPIARSVLWQCARGVAAQRRGAPRLP